MGFSSPVSDPHCPKLIGGRSYQGLRESQVLAPIFLSLRTTCTNGTTYPIGTKFHRVWLAIRILAEIRVGNTPAKSVAVLN